MYLFCPSRILCQVHDMTSPRHSSSDFPRYILGNSLMFRYFILFWILTMGPVTAYSQPESYARITIPSEQFDQARAILGVDHFHSEKDSMVAEVAVSSLEAMDRAGYSYRILIDDLTSHYQAQNRKILFRSVNQECRESDFKTPMNFKKGSMGGYLTLEEMKMELMKMHNMFPDLITAAESISSFRTSENRPILWTRISGNKSGDKKNVLYTALHHAREPLSMQQLIFFMWYLLENYEADPMVKSILDHTNLIFVPCVNPDGYAYNAQISPDGGGMWRKNRSPFGNDRYGVDLNRNYGYEWGHNNSGSSDDPEMDTYRGPEAFSEPETQAIKWLCENNDIFSALNYHSFGDYLIYPWGYTADPTGENVEFKSLARSLTFEKRILYGTSRETVLYNTNGDSDDWMYGESSSKKRIFSMTPEVGPTEYGFWPPENQIELLCRRELHQNLRMAMAPHGFVMMVPSGEPVVRAIHFVHKFYLYPVTLEEGVVQSHITPLTDNIEDYTESIYFFGLENKEEYKMDIRLRPDIQEGELIKFVLSLTNGKLTVADTVTYIYSTTHDAIDVLSHSTDIENWIRSDGSVNTWGSTTAEYYTAPSSITDSPKGLYSTATENSMVSTEKYRVPNEEKVYLTFKTKWDITHGEDYAQLSISSDGNQFIPLCGLLTTQNFDYKGDITPVYTGIQTEWLTERISLENYKGKEVYFKWTMVSQSAEARDGIFVDDMKITYSHTITPAKSNLMEWENHRLYPNPVRGNYLWLELTEENLSTSFRSYEIRSILGHIIHQGSIDALLTQISVSGYHPGVYLLQLITDKGRRVEARRFVIIR